MTDFNWDNLAKKLQKDALSDGKKVYETDERFYKLARNENDTGGALIRFLPDPEGVMFLKMIKINANGGKGKRFCNEWSPLTIGKPDPFNERFSEEWNKNNKEEAKRFGRSIRYVTNIKVIKDPANPDNDGKIFLLDMSQTIFEKVKAAAQPAPDEIALGTEPKQVYNPVTGNSFLYKVKRGSNNFITYEDSKFQEQESSIYKTADEYEKDINDSGYILNEFLKPDFYKTYEELKDCLDWFTGEKDEKQAQNNLKQGKKDADDAFGAEPMKVTDTKDTKDTNDIPFDMDEPEETKITEPNDTDDLDSLLDELE